MINMESGHSINNFTYTFDIQKSAVNDDLYIYGVASTESEDRDGETMSMKSLEKAFGRYMERNPVLMYLHNGQSDAVGKVIPEFVGEDGTVYKSGVINNELHIVGLISRALSAADVRIQIDEGILKALSIGGRARAIIKSGKRCLLMSDLREISLVPLPSNGDAMFDVIKSACVGDGCPIAPIEKQITEKPIMEKDEIVALVKSTINDVKSADETVELQKKYDALVASGTPSTDTETPEVDVIKALTDQVGALKTELGEMKTTPVKKGVQDGEIIVEKGATDITSMIVDRHYGGA